MEVKKRVLVLVFLVLITAILSSCGNKSTYNVVFKDYDDTILKEENVIHGKNATPPEEPTREGYDFVGWDQKFTKVQSNLTITAKWELKEYQATFKDGDEEIAKKLVKWNNKVTPPPTPIKAGFQFISWQLDGTDFDFNTAIKTNITLVAKWKEIIVESETFTVAFDSDGGTTIEPITVEEGTKVTRPTDPEKAGFEFVEWQLAGVKFNFNTPITSDITLVAWWVPIEEDNKKAFLENIDVEDFINSQFVLTINYEDVSNQFLVDETSPNSISKLTRVADDEWIEIYFKEDNAYMIDNEGNNAQQPFGHHIILEYLLLQFFEYSLPQEKLKEIIKTFQEELLLNISDVEEKVIIDSNTWTINLTKAELKVLLGYKFDLIFKNMYFEDNFKVMFKIDNGSFKEFQMATDGFSILVKDEPFSITMPEGYLDYEIDSDDEYLKISLSYQNKSIVVPLYAFEDDFEENYQFILYTLNEMFYRKGLVIEDLYFDEELTDLVSDHFDETLTSEATLYAKWTNLPTISEMYLKEEDIIYGLNEPNSDFIAFYYSPYLLYYNYEYDGLVLYNRNDGSNYLINFDGETEELVLLTLPFEELKMPVEKLFYANDDEFELFLNQYYHLEEKFYLSNYYFSFAEEGPFSGFYADVAIIKEITDEEIILNANKILTALPEALLNVEEDKVESIYLYANNDLIDINNYETEIIIALYYQSGVQIRKPIGAVEGLNYQKPTVLDEGVDFIVNYGEKTIKNEFIFIDVDEPIFYDYGGYFRFSEIDESFFISDNLYYKKVLNIYDEKEYRDYYVSSLEELNELRASLSNKIYRYYLNEERKSLLEFLDYASAFRYLEIVSNDIFYDLEEDILYHPYYRIEFGNDKLIYWDALGTKIEINGLDEVAYDLLLADDGIINHYGYNNWNLYEIYLITRLMKGELEPYNQYNDYHFKVNERFFYLEFYSEDDIRFNNIRFILKSEVSVPSFEADDVGLVTYYLNSNKEHQIELTIAEDEIIDAYCFDFLSEDVLVGIYLDNDYQNLYEQANDDIETLYLKYQLRLTPEEVINEILSKDLIVMENSHYSQRTFQETIEIYLDDIFSYYYDGSDWYVVSNGVLYKTKENLTNMRDYLATFTNEMFEFYPMYYYWEAKNNYNTMIVGRNKELTIVIPDSILSLDYQEGKNYLPTDITSYPKEDDEILSVKTNRSDVIYNLRDLNHLDFYLTFKSGLEKFIQGHELMRDYQVELINDGMIVILVIEGKEYQIDNLLFGNQELGTIVIINGEEGIESYHYLNELDELPIPENDDSFLEFKYYLLDGWIEIASLEELKEYYHYDYVTLEPVFGILNLVSLREYLLSYRYLYLDYPWSQKVMYDWEANKITAANYELEFNDEKVVYTTSEGLYFEFDNRDDINLRALDEVFEGLVDDYLEVSYFIVLNKILTEEITPVYQDRYYYQFNVFRGGYPLEYYGEFLMFASCELTVSDEISIVFEKEENDLNEFNLISNKGVNFKLKLVDSSRYERPQEFMFNIFDDIYLDDIYLDDSLAVSYEYYHEDKQLYLNYFDIKTPEGVIGELLESEMFVIEGYEFYYYYFKDHLEVFNSEEELVEYYFYDDEKYYIFNDGVWHLTVKEGFNLPEFLASLSNDDFERYDNEYGFNNDFISIEINIYGDYTYFWIFDDRFYLTNATASESEVDFTNAAVDELVAFKKQYYPEGINLLSEFRWYSYLKVYQSGYTKKVTSQELETAHFENEGIFIYLNWEGKSYLVENIYLFDFNKGPLIFIDDDYYFFAELTELPIVESPEPYLEFWYYQDLNSWQDISSLDDLYYYWDGGVVVLEPRYRLVEIDDLIDALSSYDYLGYYDYNNNYVKYDINSDVISGEGYQITFSDEAISYYEGDEIKVSTLLTSEDSFFTFIYEVCDYRGDYSFDYLLREQLALRFVIIGEAELEGEDNYYEFYVLNNYFRIEYYNETLFYNGSQLFLGNNPR